MNLRDWWMLRWHGHVSLRQVFWVDMCLIGTVINVLATLCTLTSVQLKWPAVLSLLIYAAPLPYNLLMLRTVWWTATGHPCAWLFRLSGLAWCVLASLL
ncbi:hypothetical protein [Aquabacterium sp.]|uniref:hypothetical protein n=1 Tax=Aquabacterium sp. TaxID=1872578 RepID=UPI0040384610